MANVPGTTICIIAGQCDTLLRVNIPSEKYVSYNPIGLELLEIVVGQAQGGYPNHHANGGPFCNSSRELLKVDRNFEK